MRFNRLMVISAASCLLTQQAFANPAATGPGYTTGLSTNTVYSIDLQTGSQTSIVSIPGSGPRDIGVANQNTAYIVGGTDRNVYSVNLQNHTYTRVTPVPLPSEGPFAVAIASNTTAYVSMTSVKKIYSVNLQNGAYSLAAAIPSPGGAILDIAMLNRNALYAITTAREIYFVDLQTGQSSLAAYLGTGPSGAALALLNNTTMYCMDVSGAFFKVDLQTGTVTQVATVPSGLNNLAINGNMTYSAQTGSIQAISLLDYSSSTVTTIPGVSLLGMSLALQMPTNGLTGNNLAFSTYLNANAPIDVLLEFALLPDGLPQALESAAPTRNAFLTYASQNAYLAASQALTDHSRQKRFNQNLQASKLVALAESPTLVTDASNKIHKPPCSEKKPYTVWFAPFGEYAKEKAQSQTPAFSMSLGGAVAAAEYTTPENHLVGSALSYAYTHVHEDGSAGQANLNQGFLSLYSTFHVGKSYFDFSLWGGYYHSDTEREISFPGVQNTAQSSTHGWQAAPHLEFGYEFFWTQNGATLTGWGMEPFLMGEWVANWEHGFKEHKGGNLNMGQKSRFCSLLRAESGLRFYEVLQFNWGNLVFQEKGSYAYQKAFDTGRLTAFLVGFPGTFTVETLGSAQNLGVVELSLLFVPKNPRDVYFDLRYQGEFGSKYQSHQGIFEVGKSF